MSELLDKLDTLEYHSPQIRFDKKQDYGYRILVDYRYDVDVKSSDLKTAIAFILEDGQSDFFNLVRLPDDLPVVDWWFVRDGVEYFLYVRYLDDSHPQIKDDTISSRWEGSDFDLKSLSPVSPVEVVTALTESEDGYKTVLNSISFDKTEEFNPY